MDVQNHLIPHNQLPLPRAFQPRRPEFVSDSSIPMADAGSGWGQLAKHLKAEIDEGLIESYKGTVSLPFQTGKNSRIAVKIVDDRGIEREKS